MLIFWFLISVENIGHDMWFCLLGCRIFKFQAITSGVAMSLCRKIVVVNDRLQYIGSSEV